MKKKCKFMAVSIMTAILCSTITGCKGKVDVESIPNASTSCSVSTKESRPESGSASNSESDNSESELEEVIAPPIDVIDWSTIPEALETDFEIEESPNGLIKIKKYVGLGGDVNIPSTISGKPVYEICKDSFLNCMSITSVNIPSSVGTIGSNAFLNCTNLVTVYLPNTEHTKTWNMGGGVFYGCISLKNVYIPDCLTGLGDNSLMLYNKT